MQNNAQIREKYRRERKLKNIKVSLLTGIAGIIILLVYYIFFIPSSVVYEYKYSNAWGIGGMVLGKMNSPRGVATDDNGNIYVADTGNNRIQKFLENGAVITWGIKGNDTQINKGRSAAEFDSPFGIAVDSHGFVYVADTGNNRIQKFTNNGTFLAKWGTFGTSSGQLYLPRGIAVDSQGFVYVADTANNRIQKFNSNGRLITLWGNNGTQDGNFQSPRGIAVDSKGFVFVADTANNRIQKFNSNGKFITLWGSNGTQDGNFQSPRGITIDSKGFVYVSDTGNNRIQKFDPNGKFVNSIGKLGHDPGDFDSPYGISADSNDFIYVVTGVMIGLRSLILKVLLSWCYIGMMVDMILIFR